MNALLLPILVSAIVINEPSVYSPCDPPQIINTISNGGTVFVDFQTTASPTLQGFNFYRDGEFLEYIAHTGDSVYTHFFTNQPPGEHSYCITSLCLVTTMGLLAEIIESEPDCEDVDCYYGFDLPFTEDWGLGSFFTSDWEISSDSWIISADTGNSPPSALFAPEIPTADYSETLESYYLNAHGMTEGHIYLEFDIRLSSIEDSGTEHLLVQVWDNQSESYSTAKDFTNQEGSFGWIRDTIDIRPYSMNKVFRVRFLAQGENSSHLNFWGVDNISVYRECNLGGVTLESTLLNDTCIWLEFDYQTRPDLAGYMLYLQMDGNLFALEYIIETFSNPYCFSEGGEYCFYLTAIWESETDQCESDFSDPACEQVIINSLKDEKMNSTITVFYNCDINILYVESGESINQVDIYDLSGRFVYSASPGNRIFNLDLSHIKPGLYLVGIESSMQTFTQKLFIN